MKQLSTAGLVGLVLLISACRDSQLLGPPKDAGTPDLGTLLPDANVIEFDGGTSEGMLPEPTLNQVLPASGKEQGGTRVVIRGTGFSEPAEVRFGSSEATSIVVLDEVSIAATTPPGAVGSVTVEVITPGGRGELVDGFRYQRELRVDSVLPDRIAELGGARHVMVRGKGFDADTVVLLDRKPLRGARLIDAEAIEGYAPSLEPGRPEVLVFNREGKVARSDLLFVYGVPRIELVEPGYGFIGGGDLQGLAGDGFEQAEEVSIGGLSSDGLVLVSGTRLEVESPALAEGVHPLTVRNADTSVTKEAAYVALDPNGIGLEVVAVVPGRASTEGGEIVTVVGRNLGLDATAEIGGVGAVVVEHVPTHSLRLMVPAGLSRGPQDLRVWSGPEKVTKTGALVLYDPIRVTSIVPDTAPATGGTEVRLQGSGFSAEGGVEVRIADVRLEDVVVVSDTEITGTIVAGSHGAHDVVVKSSDTEGRLEDGFSFEEAFAIIRLEPTEGSIAGNTYVAVLGRGFEAPSMVRFAGADGSNPTVENSSVLSVRTNPAPSGRVSVEIETPRGTETLEDAFLFYDPRLITGGAWGGPIEGSVNVAVMSFGSGQPIEGVVVQLGFDADLTYANITDANGLATISGPEIRGAQTITSGINGLEFVTYMELNARNLTILSSPHPVQPPPDFRSPCPSPVEAPVIRGRVFKFKSSLDPVTRPGWRPLAVITYTQANIFTANPPNPPTQTDFVFADGEEYEITPARPGTIAVYAILGDFNDMTQEFIPRKMGIARQIPSAIGTVIEGVDIALDFDLDRAVEVRLDAPPPQLPGPTAQAVFPYLNLGSEGVIPFEPGLVEDVGTTVVVEGLPDIAGSSFFYLSGSMTQGAGGSLNFPYSLAIEESGAEAEVGVDVGPFLRMPQNLSPKAGQVFEGSVSWDQPGATPDLTSIIVVDSTAICGSCCIDENMNGQCEDSEPTGGGGCAPVQFNRWSVFGKGGLTSYVMPRMLSGLKAFESGAQYPYLIQQALAPRFNYGEFIWNNFSPFFWKSWSITFSQFLAKEMTD